MLVAEQICIEYDKKYRGAEYSAARRNLREAYALSHGLNENQCQCVYLRQKGTEFIRRDSFLCISSIKCVEIVQNGSVYDIYFTYDLSVGKPVRTYRNAKKAIVSEDPAYLHLPLKEKAFTLSEAKPYGRIRYNGRFADVDTGQWYYEDSVVNFF